MAPRSRTGCLTCRQRKLKCSEERPMCAQCVKANRECIPSSGITFRHQQNPSLNGGEQGEGSLKSFYGYKETFAKGVQWVDIPHNLTFVHTNNPYEDDDGGAHTAGASRSNALAALAENASRYEENRRGHEYELAQAAYPAYATHGLEALSAVASQDYSYAAPPAQLGLREQAPLYQSPPALSPDQHAQAMPNQHNNLDFILNPTSKRKTMENSNIDPRLHSETPTSGPDQLPPPQNAVVETFP